MEFLIDVELDREFQALDARDRASRVQAVADLIKSEDDPAVRALAVQYADSAASRLAISMNMVNETTFKALWNVVKRAGARPVAAGGKSMEPERVRSDAQPEKLPLEMLGCVLDCPEILEDPRVETAVGLLEGEIALAIGLARSLRGNSDPTSAESFLARVPATIQDFAAQRLTRPRHEEPGAALFEFLHNAQKMRRLELSRDKESVLQELDRAGSQGDALWEERLLRDAERRAREKRGL